MEEKKNSTIYQHNINYNELLFKNINQTNEVRLGDLILKEMILEERKGDGLRVKVNMNNKKLTKNQSSIIEINNNNKIKRNIINFNTLSSSCSPYINPSSLYYSNQINNYQLNVYDIRNYSNFSTCNTSDSLPYISSSSFMNIPANTMNYLYPLQNNKLFNMSMEQLGCRNLQNKIDECYSYLSDILFPNIVDYLKDIINNQYGNYLIQKIISVEVQYQKNINESYIIERISYIVS